MWALAVGLIIVVALVVTAYYYYVAIPSFNSFVTLIKAIPKWITQGDSTGRSLMTFVWDGTAVISTSGSPGGTRSFTFNAPYGFSGVKAALGEDVIILEKINDNSFHATAPGPGGSQTFVPYIVPGLGTIEPGPITTPDPTDPVVTTSVAVDVNHRVVQTATAPVQWVTGFGKTWAFSWDGTALSVSDDRSTVAFLYVLDEFALLSSDSSSMLRYVSDTSMTYQTGDLPVITLSVATSTTTEATTTSTDPIDADNKVISMVTAGLQWVDMNGKSVKFVWNGTTLSMTIGTTIVTFVYEPASNSVISASGGNILIYTSDTTIDYLTPGTGPTNHLSVVNQSTTELALTTENHPVVVVAMSKAKWQDADGEIVDFVWTSEGLNMDVAGSTIHFPYIMDVTSLLSLTKDGILRRVSGTSLGYRVTGMTEVLISPVPPTSTSTAFSLDVSHPVVHLATAGFQWEDPNHTTVTFSWTGASLTMSVDGGSKVFNAVVDGQTIRSATQGGTLTIASSTSLVYEKTDGTRIPVTVVPPATTTKYLLLAVQANTYWLASDLALEVLVDPSNTTLTVTRKRTVNGKIDTASKVLDIDAVTSKVASGNGWLLNFISSKELLFNDGVGKHQVYPK